jgi:hypothetical protein
LKLYGLNTFLKVFNVFCRTTPKSKTWGWMDGWIDGWMNNKSQYCSTFSSLVIIKLFFGNTEFSRNYFFEIVKIERKLKNWWNPRTLFLFVCLFFLVSFRPNPPLLSKYPIIENISPSYNIIWLNIMSVYLFL